MSQEKIKTSKEISEDPTKEGEKKRTPEDLEKEKEKAIREIEGKVEAVKNKNEMVAGKETSSEKEELGTIEKEVVVKAEESKEKLKSASERAEEIDRTTLKEEVAKVGEKLSQELQEKMEKEKQVLAYGIFGKRMRGEGLYSYQKIDQMLKEKGIKLGTEEAQKFMAKYDWFEAEKSLAQEKTKGEKEILKKEIEELIKIAKQGFKGGKIDREMIQEEIGEREKRIRELESVSFGQKEVPQEKALQEKGEGKETPQQIPEKKKEEKKKMEEMEKIKEIKEYTKEDLIKIAEILGELPEEVREKYEKQVTALKEKSQKEIASLEKKAENLQKKAEIFQKKGKEDKLHKVETEYTEIKDKLEKLKSGEIAPTEVDKEIEEALKKLENYHPAVIEQAFKTVEAREKTAEEYAKIVRYAKEHKMSVENVLQKTELGAKYKETHNDYTYYYLKDLKVALAYSETEKQKQRITEKLREKEEELKKQGVPPEKIKDVLGAFLADLEGDKIEALKYYEANVLWPLLNNSERKLQRDIYKVLSKESEETAGRFTKFLKAYNKLPKWLKYSLTATAIGGGMITGGLLMGIPMALPTITAMIGYRAARAGTAGLTAGVLEKYVTQPIMNKIYKARKNGLEDQVRKEILSGKYSAEVEEAIKSENYGKWWEVNQKIFQENGRKFDELEKSHKTWSWVAAIGTGVLGGLAGGAVFDKCMHMMIPPPPIGGPLKGPEIPRGPSPDSVVHQGEGVEHAYIRQLMHNPEKFGYHGANNSEAIRGWAETHAHQLAIEHGYVNPATGAEVRVAIPNQAAYQLGADAQGHTVVREYFAGQPTDPTLAKGVNPYEYVHKFSPDYLRAHGQALVQGPGGTVTRATLEGGTTHLSPVIGKGAEVVINNPEFTWCQNQLKLLTDNEHLSSRTLADIGHEFHRTSAIVGDVAEKLHAPMDLSGGIPVRDLSGIPNVSAAVGHIGDIFKGGRSWIEDWISRSFSEGLRGWWDKVATLKVSEIMGSQSPIGGDLAEPLRLLKKGLLQKFSQSVLEKATDKTLGNFLFERTMYAAGSHGKAIFGMITNK
ncbi:hypothetical protein CO074_01635 [bacterium (Candidatus Moisslbacteria) CG_4_9_14_0_8_um_filter_36_20]|nr:MAG: hypothetical protein CO074_01635 [bacterium (Candidatus Moisslbacteria) CG_4_9_14_0_8_um_filter_36_20]